MPSISSSGPACIAVSKTATPGRFLRPRLDDNARSPMSTGISPVLGPGPRQQGTSGNVRESDSWVTLWVTPRGLRLVESRRRPPQLLSAVGHPGCGAARDAGLMLARPKGEARIARGARGPRGRSSRGCRSPGGDHSVGGRLRGHDGSAAAAGRDPGEGRVGGAAGPAGLVADAPRAGAGGGRGQVAGEHPPGGAARGRAGRRSAART